jgi:hypothetical protein
MLRTVGRALTRHLEVNNTSIHWINVVGEDSMKNVPEKRWPDNDPQLNLMLCQGHSEGMLVYVMAQNSRYKPDEAKALLQIKMLGSYATVLSEMALIWQYLDQIESLRESEFQSSNQIQQS